MIEALKNIGFVVTERLERKELSSDLQNRYSELPADYQEFYNGFRQSRMKVIMYGLIP